MLVVLGEVIDHPRFARVQFAAAEVFGGNFLAGRGLDQRWPRKENSALPAHDDALVAHRRDVGSACGAAPHHAGNLRDAFGAHVCLIEKDPSEMVAVGEDLALVRQVGPAAVDQIDARQVIGLGNLLRAQVLLDRHRVVSAALHGRIVAHDHALAARDAADRGDDPRAGYFALIHVARRQLPDLEQRRARIEQPLHPFTGQQFAARGMPFTALLVPAQCNLGHLVAKLLRKRSVMRFPRLCFGAVGIKGGGKNRGAH